MPLKQSRKRLFIHIGLNKTGSTYIQRCLIHNAARLEERGYLYPCDNRKAYSQRGQHVPLAAALIGTPIYWLQQNKKDNLPKALPLFLEAATAFTGENVVLSSEAFGSKNITRESVENILEAFQDFDVRVLVYLRRQDDYILSTYQQDVKIGLRKKFDLDVRLPLEQNRFSKRLKPWLSVLGRDRVIIRPYDRSCWSGGDLFLDFLSAIDCSVEDIDRLPVKNEGMDYRHLNIVREVNRYLSPLGTGPEGSLDQNVRDLVLNTLRNMQAGDSTVEKLALSQSEILKVQAYFLDENREIWGEDGDTFVQPRQNVDDGNTQSVAPDTDLLLRLIAEIGRDNVRLQEKPSAAGLKSGTQT